MESEKFKSVTTCHDILQEQSSNEHLNSLTSAENFQSSNHHETINENSLEGERNSLKAESRNIESKPYEVLEIISCDENATDISSIEDVPRTIMSDNAFSVSNGKRESGETITTIKNSQENNANTTTTEHNVNEENDDILIETKPTAASISLPVPSVLADKHQEVVNTKCLEVNNDKMDNEELELQQKLLQYEQHLEQLKAALQQKDNMITLIQRENAILEKEKEAFRKEKDLAHKEKESTVIKFAMKEKSVIDARKEKNLVEKQLAEAKKEIKNYTTKFQALNEEKLRVTYVMDEKCNEVRKYQRECEKLKADYGHLDSKLKYHMNKLSIETEAKLALEKKLEEERNAPNKLEEKANEKLKIEFEAQSILLKHEIAQKTEQLEKALNETEIQKDVIKQLQEQLNKETKDKIQLQTSYNELHEEHNYIQNSYSQEMLNSAKLRVQLDELQVLKTQNTLNEEKIFSLNQELQDAIQKLQDNEQDLKQLRAKEQELLSFNKEMSESIVNLQNQICLLKSEAQGITAENELLKRERLDYDAKYAVLENKLKEEQNQKNEERLLLTKHLSEKTKLYENTKMKLENLLGDFEATKNKHVTIVKELQRDIIKYKRAGERSTDSHGSLNCSRCHNNTQNNGYHHKENEHNKDAVESSDAKRPHSRQSSISTAGGHSLVDSRRGSESSESDTVTGREIEFKDDKGLSKKQLIERILRLQQASARQTEKIDFLEQHTLSLVAELQKKSKVVQYYMIRDQAGALTSSKSDQNKSDLAKYGNGVMSAIYGGIKGVENKSMSLELSLEINKKLQAVLEDTLLKNITLKENLDVLGLEVDNLTRKLRQIEGKQ